METLKEILLSIKTELELKGPFKVQLVKVEDKAEKIVQTIKIRMKDDITHVIQLSQGSYKINVLQKDIDFLSCNIVLPNFESGSQMKLTISDVKIEANLDGIVKYKTVDEVLEEINNTSKEKIKKKNEKKKQIKNKKQEIKETKTEPKVIKENEVIIEEKEEIKSEKNEEKAITISASNTKANNTNNKENNLIKNQDIENLREEFMKEISRLNSKVERLETEIQELKNSTKN